MTTLWGHDELRPLESAGPMIPIVPTASGRAKMVKDQHGTAFFLSSHGLFVTARHVVDEALESFVARERGFQIQLISGRGISTYNVNTLIVHSRADIAVGFVEILPQHLTRPFPLVISKSRLAVGADVCVLGYPRNKVIDEGDGQRVRYTPDYYEGKVEDHQMDGIGMVRNAAYQIAIAPPGDLKNLAGLSGGPMLSTITGHVHGLLSSSTHEYGACSDIELLSNWAAFAPYLDQITIV